MIFQEMKLNLKSIILVFICILQLSSKAQQVSTMYFMDNSPVRHFYNPAFQPENDFYLSLPAIGFTQFGIGNNSLTLKNLIYKNNGQTISALSSSSNLGILYNQLSLNTNINSELQTNLIGFGFRHLSDYWTFSMSEKALASVVLPKDLFKLGILGTTNFESNNFDLSKLQTNLTLYTEFAFGFSRIVDYNWTIGAKLKFLYGTANISNASRQAQLNAGLESWSVLANGSVNYSSPGILNISNNLNSIGFTSPTSFADWLKPSGLGAGMDVGAEYKPNDNFSFTAAITDLGFLVWYHNVKNYDYAVNFKYTGLISIDNNSTVQSIQDIFNKFTTKNGVIDSLVKVIKSSGSGQLASRTYTTGTLANLNLGGEYKILENRLSFGLLSHTRFQNETMSEELSLSVNARPYKWINASLSTSFFNGNLSSIGAGIGVKIGFIHLFAAADYLPFQKVTIPTSVLGLKSIAIPYNTKYYNFATGINIVIDKSDRTVRNMKIEKARRLGLRNRTQSIPADPTLNIPNTKKPVPNNTKNNRNGLHHYDKIPDCHCPTN
jgi:hypothetical protein